MKEWAMDLPEKEDGPYQPELCYEIPVSYMEAEQDQEQQRVWECYGCGTYSLEAFSVPHIKEKINPNLCCYGIRS